MIWPPLDYTMNSYSLRLLFVMVTVAATLAAAFGGILGSDMAFVELGHLVLSVVACGLAGGVIGAVIGSHDYQRVRGVLLGGAVGCLVGALISPLVFINADAAPQVFAAQVTGAIVLIAVGISARIAQK